MAPAMPTGDGAPGLRLGDAPPGFRSGFVAVVGRPNVGKSTLVNRLCGRKIAITASRPQTTRNAIRGVLTTEEAQVVFVDTPGLHKPRTTLGEKLNEVVRGTLRQVDAVLFVVDASGGVGRGDAFIAAELPRGRTPVVAVLNKVDLTDEASLGVATDAVGRLGDFEVVPTAALVGAGLAELLVALVEHLPEGPLYYPPDMVTDQPEEQLVAELVREKVLELTREEVPHSVAVVIEEMAPREGSDLVDIDAVIYVERPSQKGIVIGQQGRMLKEVGTRAREEIEALLGSRVFLRLRVKVERDWQKRAALVTRFGYGS